MEASQPYNNKRLRKEYSQFSEHANLANIKAFLFHGNLFNWKGYIEGPSSTPYQGGIFQINIQMPENYPSSPPKMTFDTKIWHPNVSSLTGEICMTILKAQWTPALTIRTLLLSVQAILDIPDFEDPLDSAVAVEYQKDKNCYAQHAREWVKKYASPQLNESKILRLVQMGFPKEMALAALQMNHFGEEEAIAYLTGEGDY